MDSNDVEEAALIVKEMVHLYELTIHGREWQSRAAK